MRKIAYIASARAAGAAFLATLALSTNSTNGAATDLIWSGTTTLWDTSSSSKNWSQFNASAGKYQSTSFSNGDNVTFQDINPATGTAFTSPITISIQSTNPAVSAGSINFTNSATAYTFNTSPLRGSTLTKSGAGTVTLSTGGNITGSTSVSTGTLSVGAGFSSAGGIQVTNGGTLLLGNSNVIGNAAGSTGQTNITLGGGTFKTGGFSEGNASTAGLGTLTLTTTSVLDFSSTGGLLHFTSLSTIPSGTSLKIYNWDSGDHLYFNNASTLTPSQLSQITFYSDAGNTKIGTAGGGLDGSMTPVPEPSTILAGIGLVGMIGYRERRRIKSLITREPLVVA